MLKRDGLFGALIYYGTIVFLNLGLDLMLSRWRTQRLADECLPGYDSSLVWYDHCQSSLILYRASSMPQVHLRIQYAS
jgi:hypothetical protein